MHRPSWLEAATEYFGMRVEGMPHRGIAALLGRASADIGHETRLGLVKLQNA